MSFLEQLGQVSPPGDTALTIGVFDGLHLGHQHLLSRLKAEAQERGLVPGVLTFRNHPRAVLHPGEEVGWLSDLDERLDLLRSTGLDLVVVVDFTRELSLLRPREFLSLLQQRLRLRALVVGPDFALGYQRQGDRPTLEALGREMGFTVTTVEHYMVDGVGVRSTHIRNLISQGDVAGAARMLGRNYSIRGIVVRGDGRGRRLGYPTANLAVDSQRLVPGNGIYATWAYVGDARYPAATSIGVRPTFGQGQRTVESYLMDFSGVLYHKEMRLEFVRRLRDELAFPSVEALVQQMGQDVAQAREVLAVGKR